jgi:hypothetical protein
MAQAAPAPETVNRSVTIPGGVTDSAGKIGYVVNEKGGVSALNLEDGKELWTIEGPAKPLAVFENRLVIQIPAKDKGNEVRVDIVDTTEHGKLVRKSDAIVFPDWVVTGLTHGRTFSSSGWIDGKSLYLKWEARAFYAGGARPTPDIEKAAKKEASGVAAVDLESGKVGMLDETKQRVVTEPKLSDELAKVTSRQYFTGTEWLTKPAVAGSSLAALVQDDLPGNKKKLILKRWDISTGKEKEPVDLLTGMELWPLIPEGSKYLFVHQALPKEKLPEGDFAWWIYSLETGKQEAKIPFEGNMDLHVAGARAFYTVMGPAKGPGFGDQPRTLKCVDLKTGKALWEYALEPIKHLLPLP